MSETTKERCHSNEEEGEVEIIEHKEEEQEQDREEDEVEDEELSKMGNPSSLSSSSSFLTELNLIMIATLLTLSDEELSKMDESENKLAVAGDEREAKGKVSAAAPRKKQRDCGALKSADRRLIARSQSRIMDSRHGRKM